MGFYREYIFPHLLEFTERVASVEAIRERVVEGATGHVLEIGAGVGSNLFYYPRSVVSLTTLDRNPAMNARVRRRVKYLPFPVDTREGHSENLPMKDRSFDCVVTTFTLCAVENIEQTLSELFRVLKPGGRLLFAEYGLSHDEEVAKWQQRLTPYHRFVADGCQLDRRIDQLIPSAGFIVKRLATAHLTKLPRALGFIYEGMASKDA